MPDSDTLIMTRTDRIRLDVLTRLELGEFSPGTAATALRISLRQLFRLRARFRTEGAAGIVHAGRGRVAPNRVPDTVREQVISFARTRYFDFNVSHFRDMLATQEGLLRSTATVRRILLDAGLLIPRPKRRKTHRLRRDRMTQAGILVQVDGSNHHWFGKELPRASLLAAIDDATNTVLAAVFREQEDAQGYLLLIQQMLRTYGRPLELYHDRHAIFERNPPRPWSLDEELTGEQAPTEVSRALDDLGILSIAAHSPQAKGRIERLWGTWQDRLVAELRLAGITDIETANAYLPTFLATHNARFTVTAADPGTAFRPLPHDLDLDRVLSLQTERRVRNDNTVSVNGRMLQISPGPWRRSYAGAMVLVHLHLDGSISLWHGDQQLLRTAPPPSPPTLRNHRRKRLKDRRLVTPPAPQQISLPPPTPRPRVTTKPAANHPWRGQPGAAPPPVTDRLPT